MPSVQLSRGRGARLRVRRPRAGLRIATRLSSGGGLMMRYAEADDFGMPETAFLVCTFWYIDALANSGRRAEALRREGPADDF